MVLHKVIRISHGHLTGGVSYFGVPVLPWKVIALESWTTGARGKCQVLSDTQQTGSHGNLRGICGSCCFAGPWSHRGPSGAADTRSPGLVCRRDTPDQLVGSILPFQEAASRGPRDIPTRRITLELNPAFQR